MLLDVWWLLQVVYSSPPVTSPFIQARQVDTVAIAIDLIFMRACVWIFSWSWLWLWLLQLALCAQTNSIALYHLQFKMKSHQCNTSLKVVVRTAWVLVLFSFPRLVATSALPSFPFFTPHHSSPLAQAGDLSLSLGRITAQLCPFLAFLFWSPIFSLLHCQWSLCNELRVSFASQATRTLST